jgi:hypothetical protein
MGGIEDEVVAFAVAVGAGDAEAVAGGGEGEGEFGDFSAAFGGLFALVGGLRAGSLRGDGWRGAGGEFARRWLARCGRAGIGPDAECVRGTRPV